MSPSKKAAGLRGTRRSHVSRRHGAATPLAETRPRRPGLVEKNSTWPSYEGTKIAQGRDKALAHFEEHPKLAEQLRDALIRQARQAASRNATTATSGGVS